eukprot:7169776-Prymnesium_polylepis.2
MLLAKLPACIAIGKVGKQTSRVELRELGAQNAFELVLAAKWQVHGLTDDVVDEERLRLHDVGAVLGIRIGSSGFEATISQ